MDIGQLTTEEIALIQKGRDESAKHDAARAFKSKAIAVAAAFEKWSDETGDGLTFSTFIDTFGYQDSDGKQMYEAVKRIQQAAWPQ